MVRNIANMGPSFTPRPKPDTSSSDRAELLRAQRAQSSAQAPKPYTPWTGGGDSRFITAPGDSTIEYGTNRTRTPGGPPPVEDVEEVPKETRRPSDIGWQDSAYNTQIAALERALRDFETGTTTRGERYGQDFMTGLNRLGFRPGASSVGMPNIVEALNQQQATARGMSGGAPGVSVDPVKGDWDYEGQAGRTSAAARGTRGMRDEFAGRGTLRSSDFRDSFDDFQTRLGQQFDAMQTGRGRFAQDLGTELAQFRARTGEQKAAAEESARSRAIMRSIQEMGF